MKRDISFRAICIDPSYGNECYFMREIKSRGLKNIGGDYFLNVYGEWLEVDEESIIINDSKGEGLMNKSKEYYLARDLWSRNIKKATGLKTLETIEGINTQKIDEILEKNWDTWNKEMEEHFIKSSGEC